MALCHYCRKRDKPKRGKHCGHETCRRQYGAHLSRMTAAKKKSNADGVALFERQAVRPVDTGPDWRRHLDNLARFYQMEMGVLAAAGANPLTINSAEADKILAKKKAV